MSPSPRVLRLEFSDYLSKYSIQSLGVLSCKEEGLKAQPALVRNQVPGCTLGLSTCLAWSPGGTVNAFPWQALFWTASLSFQAGGMVRLGAQH